jgi:inner membrane transporter RhtA
MGRLFLPIAAGVVAMAAFQVSASFAKALFPVMGALGAASIRLLLGALMLLALTRPWRKLPDKPPWGAIVGLGVSVAGAVALFYGAISRLPQGVAIALQFLGPLAVALTGSRRIRDLVWAALAVAGVWALVGQGAIGSGRIDPLGVVFALGAAVGWAGYILFGRRTGAVSGRVGAAFATAIAAILVLPVGLTTAGSTMFTVSLLPLAATVALFSTVVPFSLELFAMARMPGKTFAILTSLEPAFGCLSGLILLHERLSAAQLLGVAAVFGAAAGATWSAGEEETAAPPTE